MKYLKTYEIKSQDIQIGDYVHLKDESTWTVYPDVKVIDIANMRSDNPSYHVESQMKVDNRIEFFCIYLLDDVKRKSTSKEIKDYELRKTMNKYNL